MFVAIIRFKRRCFTERLDSVVVDVLYFVAKFKRESHVSFRVFNSPAQCKLRGVGATGGSEDCGFTLRSYAYLSAVLHPDPVEESTDSYRRGALAARRNRGHSDRGQTPGARCDCHDDCVSVRKSDTGR